MIKLELLAQSQHNGHFFNKKSIIRKHSCNETFSLSSAFSKNLTYSKARLLLFNSVPLQTDQRVNTNESFIEIRDFEHFKCTLFAVVSNLWSTLVCKDRKGHQI